MAVEGLGYAARVAADGVEALAARRNLEYDVVLLEIMMPEMDGFEVFARMKADVRMRDVPVIAISALDDETETVVKAIELGAENFLPKDFDLVLPLTRFDMSNGAQNAWLRFAMLLPLLFAIEALVLTGNRPEHIDIFASVGLVMALSTILLVPLAYARGDLMSLGPQIGRLEVLVVLMGIVGPGSLLLAVPLIYTAGAVFYCQSAYAMTTAGVVWGMLLLNEGLSSLAWVAFAVIVVGMYLVEPKSRDEEVLIKRSFKD